MTYMREMKQGEQNRTQEPTRRFSMQRNERWKINEQTLTLAGITQDKVTKHAGERIILDMMRWTKWSITDAHRAN